MKLNDSEINEIMENLDRECWNCQHGSSGYQRDDDGKCYICHGVGTTLNTSGRLLLDFIARHQVELEMKKQIARMSSR